MAECNIRKSYVWDKGSVNLTIEEHNELAEKEGYGYFAYGQTIFIVNVPFWMGRAKTAFLKKDLIDE